MLGVGFHHPHTKWHVPRGLYERLEKETRVAPPEKDVFTVGAPTFAFGDINLGSNGRMLDGPKFDIPEKPWEVGSKPMLSEAAVEMRRGYFTAIAFMDAQFGRVLRALDASGVANDTVVIFTSDHGYGAGERGHWGKGSLYEIDARVPLIVRDPAAPRSRGRTSATARNPPAGFGVPLGILRKSRSAVKSNPFPAVPWDWPV